MSKLGYALNELYELRKATIDEVKKAVNDAYKKGLEAQRKPLTEEQIDTVWSRVQADDFHDCVQLFARAIEAAHGIKEKNT